MNIINIEQIGKFLKIKDLSKVELELIKSAEEEFVQILNRKFKEYKNKQRVIKNDDSKEKIRANDFLSQKDINLLPSWVRKDIENSYIIGNSKQVIQTSDNKKYHLKNKLNDLSGGEWTFFLNSVINTRFTTGVDDGYAHHIRKVHPSPKPPQLMRDIIKFFTKENELVLDYFMGVGGTLLGASLSNRRAIGVDLSEEYINTYKEANKFLGLKEQRTIQGDSVGLLKNQNLFNELAGEEVSLILIDPPYGDMMNRKKTGEAIKLNKDTSATPYTSYKEDLGNMEENDFRRVFKESVEEAILLLKNKGHLVIFIKDMQPKGKNLNLLHCNMILDLNNITGLYYLGTKIWADQGVNLYPYGYPFSYVSNQIHQYILIFQKNI